MTLLLFEYRKTHTETKMEYGLRSAIAESIFCVPLRRHIVLHGGQHLGQRPQDSQTRAAGANEGFRQLKVGVAYDGDVTTHADPIGCSVHSRCKPIGTPSAVLSVCRVVIAFYHVECILFIF